MILQQERSGGIIMDYFRTQYEELYKGDDYYWGTEPADFLNTLIELSNVEDKKLRVLDIGCGEGKDAVYMAEKGFEVEAFDITESGIKKTIKLAEQRKAKVNAYVADINNFDLDGEFDIVYSTGTIQYLYDEEIDPFFEKVKKHTAPNGLNFFNVFVDKPFLEIPPDWDKEEKMWKTGDIFKHYYDWEILKIDEVIFEDNSGGVKHFHCMDTIIARKR